MTSNEGLLVLGQARRDPYLGVTRKWVADVSAYHPMDLLTQLCHIYLFQYMLLESCTRSLVVATQPEIFVGRFCLHNHAAPGLLAWLLCWTWCYLPTTHQPPYACSGRPKLNRRA